MTTRAVLLTSSGAVHRLSVNANGAEITACGQAVERAGPVTPQQALVYRLVHCAHCWREREHQWQHFVEGIAP